MSRYRGNEAMVRSFDPSALTVTILLTRSAGTPRPKASCEPSGENATVVSTSYATLRGAPPSAGTAYSHANERVALVSSILV